MFREFRPALTLVVLFTLLTGLVLPVLFTGFAQLAFPFQANGSLIRQSGQIIGSARIGQNFTAPVYFQSRPSALTGTDAKGTSIATPYDASESGASNLAATSKGLQDSVTARIAAYRRQFGPGPVPIDAVTASGSGLDPDISLANALRQAPAVAAARHWPVPVVIGLVDKLAQHPLLGFIGEARVDVLALNLALDHEKP
jgi:K+-transporting ATPase ATPase C chain